MITYLVTDSGVYAFLCGRDQAFCWELGTSSVEIGASVAALRNVLDRMRKEARPGPAGPAQLPIGSSPAVAEIRKPLADLYRQLLAPLAADLPAASVLVFALPRELMGLPDARPDPKRAGIDPRFLIQDYAVTYLSEGMLDESGLS